MASFNKFDCFVEDLAEKVHDLGSDTLKVALTNTAPTAADCIFSDLTEISAGNGYSAGGTQATVTSSGQTSGTYKLVLDDVTFTATGSVGPFQYAVLYNSSAADDPLIGWWNYGVPVTLAASQLFTIDFDATAGVLTLA